MVTFYHPLFPCGYLHYVKLSWIAISMKMYMNMNILEKLFAFTKDKEIGDLNS